MGEMGKPGREPRPQTGEGNVDAERALLNVHPESGPALAAYRAWGYRKAGEGRPGGGAAELHEVMVLDLRRPLSGRTPHPPPLG
ncbi:hypothetical protein ACWEJQ_06660 [Streptomyces albidoflavus]